VGPQSEIYAAQLIELLSDVVDTLNEAKADGMDFVFQIGQLEGKYVLASLTAAQAIVPPAPILTKGGTQ
jgi:hypothetical protein